MRLKVDERKKTILQATINNYIETAEPVGSKYLCERYDFDLSSATVRHELNELEQEGFLTQIHTSSGRVPTDKGYRYYVDNLMRINELNKAQKELINEHIVALGHNIYGVLMQISTAMASVIDYTTIILTPDVYEETLKVAHLILVDIDKILVVLLDSLGVNNEFLLRIQHKMSQDDLNKISRMLTDKLKGRTLNSIDDQLIGELVQELPLFHGILNKLVDELKKMRTVNQKQKKLLTSGVSNMLKLPEFKNIELTQQVLTMIEENKVLLGILAEYMKEQNCRVLIGEETQVEALKDLSLVVAPFSVESTGGVMGVLGPKRMMYSVIVPIIQSITHNIQTYIDGPTAKSNTRSGGRIPL